MGKNTTILTPLKIDTTGLKLEYDEYFECLTHTNIGVYTTIGDKYNRECFDILSHIYPQFVIEVDIEDLSKFDVTTICSIITYWVNSGVDNEKFSMLLFEQYDDEYSFHPSFKEYYKKDKTFKEITHLQMENCYFSMYNMFIKPEWILNCEDLSHLHKQSQKLVETNSIIFLNH